MQTVLVAGGAGFIGIHLCTSLLNRNVRVISLDNFITGSKSNIEPLLKKQNFSFIEYDITNSLDSIQKKLSEVTHIFHLASPASPNKKSTRSYINYPIETLLANSQGTHHLLELAKVNRAQFVYSSSSEVYGDPTESPQKESYFGNVNPNGIRSVYDEGKRFGEAIVMAYVRKYNVDGRIVRIFNTYGPLMQKDDGRVVSNFINQALKNENITVYGTGTQTRSFCYVSDMVDALEKAMFTDNLKGEVINLGNPDERTISELATMVKDLTHSHSEVVYEEASEDDPKTRKPDISKAKKLLGWEPKVSLEEGLKKTISYFQAS